MGIWNELITKHIKSSLAQNIGKTSQDNFILQVSMLTITQSLLCFTLFKNIVMEGAIGQI